MPFLGLVQYEGNKIGMGQSHQVKSSMSTLSFCIVAPTVISQISWQKSQRNSHILTYHASNALGTKEALTTGLAILDPQRHIFQVPNINLVLLCNTATPSGFTPGSPRSQIAVLIGFQIVVNGRALLKKVVEVEIDFCCRTYSACNVSWSFQNLVINR